jgi:hypothetical protein
MEIHIVEGIINEEEIFLVREGNSSLILIPNFLKSNS